MAEHSIKKKELKNLLLELLEEDQSFLHKIFSVILLRKDTIDFFHRLNLEVLRNYFKSEKKEALEPLIDKEKYKYLIGERFDFLDTIAEKPSKAVFPKKPKQELVDRWKKKYAIKKEAIEDLQELFKDEPPASELVKLLSK